MKMLYGVLALLALASLSFADSQCEQSCCYSAGGSWDYDYEYCEDASSSYYSCINNCEGNMGASYSCCGSAFVMAAVGALFVSRRQP